MTRPLVIESPARPPTGPGRHRSALVRPAPSGRPYVVALVAAAIALGLAAGASVFAFAADVAERSAGQRP